MRKGMKNASFEVICERALYSIERKILLSRGKGGVAYAKLGEIQWTFGCNNDRVREVSGRGGGETPLQRITS